MHDVKAVGIQEKRAFLTINPSTGFHFDNTYSVLKRGQLCVRPALMSITPGRLCVRHAYSSGGGSQNSNHAKRKYTTDVVRKNSL